MNEIFSTNLAYHLFLYPFIFSHLFLGFRPLSIQPQFLSDTRLSYSFKDIVVVSCLVSLILLSLVLKLPRFGWLFFIVEIVGGIRISVLFSFAFYTHHSFIQLYIHE
jgi:hypothetical protein